ncbi:MAG TPA: BrnT family toxin [Gammaproteobacteria bacterium]|nr:BrnT family toxin [Gammaproteobacteria bacterium]
MEYDFEWDANKARTNFRKHRISFIQATSVFKDPLAVSIIDDEHSETEERWITLGQTR